MALVGFQYEPVSLDVNEVLIRVKNQEQIKAFLNGADVGNEVDTNIEYLRYTGDAPKSRLWDTFNYQI